MPSTRYDVRLAEDAAAQFRAFDRADRKTVLGGLHALKVVAAIPAETADGVRLRDRNLDQPLYYRPTGPFGLFFVILDDMVRVLAIERRPTLRTEAGR
jgi:hypothetical protein